MREQRCDPARTHTHRNPQEWERALQPTTAKNCNIMMHLVQLKHIIWPPAPRERIFLGTWKHLKIRIMFTCGFFFRFSNVCVLSTANKSCSSPRMLIRKQWWSSPVETVGPVLSLVPAVITGSSVHHQGCLYSRDVSVQSKGQYLKYKPSDPLMLSLSPFQSFMMIIFIWSSLVTPSSNPDLCSWWALLFGSSFRFVLDTLAVTPTHPLTRDSLLPW